MSYYVWTCPAEKFLLRFYESRGAVFIAEWLHINHRRVQDKARRLGLRTKVARGLPFQSIDHRRGPGRRFTSENNMLRKQRIEIK